MSYVTCPNCGVTLSAAVTMEPPTICPDCCARLHRDTAFAPLPPVAPAPASSLDRVILSGADAPGEARREFRSFAAHLGDDVTTTGSLLISEVVTNAVKHGPAGDATTIGLHCAIAGSRLQVEIADDGGGFLPRERYEGQDPGSGWGLHIVETLSRTWGVDDGRPTRVWFELAL